jgi:hypothetical protein
VVHRSLCLMHQFGKRCEVCPNGKIKVFVEVTDEP